MASKIYKEVEYFVKLFKKNIQIVKTNKPEAISKKEMVFFNFNVRLDGQEIVVYNQEKDIFYDIFTNEIQNLKFVNINKSYVLNIIHLLTKYINNEITFKKFINLIDKENIDYNYI